MSAASYLRSLYRSWCAPEKSHRPLFRRVAERKPQRIVELGIGDASRALSLLELVGRHHEQPVEYCGIDGFELHEGALSVKAAHAKLVGSGAKIRLLPGDPVTSLARNANFLTGTDLLICDASIDREAWARAQVYVPRMLADHALVARFEVEAGKLVLHWEDSGAEVSNRRVAA